MADILFVCTAFAPKNIIGSIRPTKLAKYMVRMGHRVTVILPVLGENEPQDELLMSPEMDSVRRVAVPNGGLYHRIKGIYKKGGSGKGGPARVGTRPGLKRTAWFFFNLYTEASWFFRVRRALKNNPPKKPYDAVISTYPNIGTHWAARYVMKKGWARRWVADFRDPLVYDWLRGPELWINRLIQKRVVRSSWVVTAVSRGIKSKLQKLVNQDKIVWIPNGFDPDDLAVKGAPDATQNTDSTDKNRLVFSYAGGLYGGTRDMRVLFAAIRDLVSENALPPDGCAFDYAGRDGGVLLSQARESGMEACVRDLGFLSREEALLMQTGADCSVVCTHNSKNDQGVMPGKFYETLLIGKPLLVIVNGDAGGSEIGSMTKELNAGIVYEQANHEEDYKQLKAGIAGFFQEKLSMGALSATLDQSKRERYSYEHLAREFMDLIDPAPAPKEGGVT